MNLYDFLRLDPKDYEYSIVEFAEAVGKVKGMMIELEERGEIIIENAIHELNLEELIKIGVKAVGTYHDKEPVKIPKKSQKVITEDLNLLLFYSNRLEHYDLHKPLYVTHPIPELTKLVSL